MVVEKNECSIFVKEIKAEKTVRLGWLLFSFQGLDCKKLMMEITELCRVEISARYKSVLTDKWDPTIDTKKILKAVHLECADSERARSLSELKNLYSSSATEFPVGIQMRLIAE